MKPLLITFPLICTVLATGIINKNADGSSSISKQFNLGNTETNNIKDSKVRNLSNLKDSVAYSPASLQ